MPTLEERIAALEVKIAAQTMSGTELRGTLAGLQDQMNRRFEQVDRRFEQVDHRFTELQGQMNQRFDSADQKTDRQFTWLVGIQVGVLVAVVGRAVRAFSR